MATEKNNVPAHETHLGVDAWLETSEAEETSDGFMSAARILAGEDPVDPEQE